MKPTIVRLQKGSRARYWQAVWTDASGKRRTKNLGRIDELSSRRAQQACLRFAATVSTEPWIREGGRSPTLKDWTRRYMEHRTDLEPATVYVHQECIDRLLRFFHPDVRLDRITRAVASDWRAHLSESMSEATVCKYVRTAKVIFNRAVAEDQAPANPFDRLKGSAANPNEGKTRVFSEREIERLLDACPTWQWRNLVGLCAYAALRSSEAIALRREDVHFTRNRLIVRAKNGKETTKSRQREVLLSPKLATLLLETWDLATDARVVGLSGANIHAKMTKTIVPRSGVRPYRKPLHALRASRSTVWKTIDHYPELVVDAWVGHSARVAREHYNAVPEKFYGVTTEVETLRAEIDRLRQALARSPSQVQSSGSHQGSETVDTTP